MASSPLRFDDYQASAASTDRTRSKASEFDLPILGLFGETGSLLAEVKKRQRDSAAHGGYRDRVVEEMGDVLWYLAVIADRVAIPLSRLANHSSKDGRTSDQMRHLVDLQPQRSLDLDSPTVAFERTLLRLAGAAGRLAEHGARKHGDQADLEALLAEILRLLVEAANEAGVTLDEAARGNMAKAADRWASERTFPLPFDEAFPFEERLPRSLDVDVFEREAANGKHYVVQRCNGVFIGDRLTDNIVTPDDYRFHDVFHYANAAVLGWSPVTRALLRLKRKSETKIDEGQDGARAIIIEEAISAYVFGEAKREAFFEDASEGDLGFSLLKSVRQFARGYEVDRCPLWLWERAILQGCAAFRFLRLRRRGTLRIDLPARELRIEEMPA